MFSQLKKLPSGFVKQLSWDATGIKRYSSAALQECSVKSVVGRNEVTASSVMVPCYPLEDKERQQDKTLPVFDGNIVVNSAFPEHSIVKPQLLTYLQKWCEIQDVSVESTITQCFTLLRISPHTYGLQALKDTVVNNVLHPTLCEIVGFHEPVNKRLFDSAHRRLGKRFLVAISKNEQHYCITVIDKIGDLLLKCIVNDQDHFFYKFEYGLRLWKPTVSMKEKVGDSKRFCISLSKFTLDSCPEYDGTRSYIKPHQQHIAVKSAPSEQTRCSPEISKYLSELSSVPWKVNEKVLDVAISERDQWFVQSKDYSREFSKQAEVDLSLAKHLLEKPRFFFSYELDFRGRAYSTSTHFSHYGGDLERGLLKFAEGKPLGPGGLRWLKLFCVNLTECHKRSSIKERLSYAESVMHEIHKSAENPKEYRWWAQFDNRWQILAVCNEIHKAHASGDPENYVCSLPVQQDGTCNGAQHYTALALDKATASHVNLVPNDKPGDLYSAIAEKVEKMRLKDVKRGVPAARLFKEGYINRKAVKRTVMTMPYGVTEFGARRQQLEYLRGHFSIPEEKLDIAAKYLTKIVFDASSDINPEFVRIKDIARRVSLKNLPVEWRSPIGLTITQCYANTKSGENRRNAIALRKAVGSFPANFVHSLDASHMFFTASECFDKGIPFAAVHDCFFTLPCMVDDMNKICREQFIKLHSENLLEDLASQLFGNESYSKVMKPDLKAIVKSVPKRGQLDLQHVLKSEYFFQ